MPETHSGKKPEDVLMAAVHSLPECPGVYQYYSAAGELLYVGKAKNLRKRVSSYFNKKHDSLKTQVLVKKISKIESITVSSESDALLLENSLIKQHQPRYNVLLRDDKTYPWVCVKSEPFPRVLLTRAMVKDGSVYFGPYTNLKAVKSLLEIIKRSYKIRSCQLNLAQNQIAKGKYKVCLEYHIKNCLAPCTGLQEETDYAQAVAHVKAILRGNVREVTKQLRQQMAQAAEELRFEDAQAAKDKIEQLENYQSKSTIVSPSINDIDVFSVLDDSDRAYVNFMKIASGAIIQSHTIELRKKLDESPSELLEIGITEIREKFSSSSAEIVVPFMPEFAMENIKFTVPQKGEKKQLLELSETNLKYFKLEKAKQLEKIDPEKHGKRIVARLQKDLGLTEPPVHIECFDNSNIQGAYPVAACVVFRNGRPCKKDYRHFDIKTVIGPDDFASMEEVLTRRYTRLLEEGQPLPQLVVIDGGKGQLSSAVSVLNRLGIMGRVNVIGIAKRLEEIFFPADPVPLYLDKNSDSLKVLQHLRNEAHRFGITHHRNKRSRDFIKSELLSIPGIGAATAEMLLGQYKSVQAVKEAAPGDLEIYVGKKKADIIAGFFKSGGSPEQ
jgi:excinuclease ABC subunit C